MDYQRYACCATSHNFSKLTDSDEYKVTTRVELANSLPLGY